MLHGNNTGGSAAPGGAGNWVHIQTVDSAASPITFDTGINGNDASVIGYWMGGEVASADNTQIGIRYNNNAGGIYSTVRTDNDGLVIASATDSGQTQLNIHPGGTPVQDGQVLSFYHWIPISIFSGVFNLQGIKSFTVATSPSGEGPLGLWDSAHLFDPGLPIALTRIDVIAVAGAFRGTCRVALYKLTR